MDLIPCLVVSGYLGAGKTTLINRFLADPHGVRAVVLINDFGKVNIDSHLIENASENTIELSNGCACCSIGDNLLRAAHLAAQRQPRPDLIVVEASGVARPDRIATLLLGAAGLADAQIVTVVDVSQTRAALADKYISHLFLHQIAVAHWLAPNRETPDSDELLHRLNGRAHNGGHRIKTLTQVMDKLLCLPKNDGRAPKAAMLAPGDDNQPVDEFAAQTVTIPDGTAHDIVTAWLSALPEHIHRVKGFARLCNSDGGLALYSLSKTRAQVRLELTTASIPVDVVGQIVLIAPVSLGWDHLKFPIPWVSAP